MRTVTPAIGRLAWIDWLKVIVVTGVVVYHAAQPFVLTSWIVVDEDKSLLLSAFAGLGYLFGMPLMFGLAGAASWAALQGTTVGGYVGKRLRLVVPLLVGIAVLSPLQAWIGNVSRGDSAGLLGFTARYWADADVPLSPVWLGDYGYHLWFIGFLLIYAVISVPVLVRIRPNAVPMRPTVTWLVVVPIAALLVTQLPLRVAFPTYRDWADFALWLGYFVAGAVLLAWPAALATIRERGLRMLVPGLVLAAVMIPIYLVGPGLALESSPRPDGLGLAYVALRTAIGWCWVIVAVAIGARWLDRRPAAARMASGLVLPVYVLHHPIVVVVAATVVAWPWGWGPKFVAILGVSGLLTLGASLAVARAPLLRLLIGMGRRRGTPPSTAVAT